MSGSQNISDGSARSYELSGLEEDSDYTITLIANVGTGSASSNQRSATTNTAGTIIHSDQYPVFNTLVMIHQFLLAVPQV